MAYIPPHKRHSRDMENPYPTPELLAPQFNKNLNLRPCAPHFIRKSDSKPSGSKGGRSKKIIYADEAIRQWYCIRNFGRGNQNPSFEPISVPFIERLWGEKPHTLVSQNTNISKGSREEEGEVATRPWKSTLVKLLHDLLSSIEHVKNEMNQDIEDVKPKLVARIGKALFNFEFESDTDKLPPESEFTIKRMIFYTNVSETYVEYIKEQVIPLIGVEFEEEKDIYLVKLLDAERPTVTLSCKCTAVPELNNLLLYKVELDELCHMLADVSCPTENLDMSFMLNTKKTLTKHTDDEMEGILDLINSAVVDQGVKGGVRWPLGKASSGDRFRVLAVWHTVAKSYVNPFLRLKLRNVDRFSFVSSIGEVAYDVTLKLKQLTSELLKEKAEIEEISEMLNDHMKLLWNHFVCTASCSGPFLPT